MWARSCPNTFSLQILKPFAHDHALNPHQALTFNILFLNTMIRTKKFLNRIPFLIVPFTS